VPPWWARDACAHPKEEAARNVRIDATGGLTMERTRLRWRWRCSLSRSETPAVPGLFVRKTPKAHGQTKLIEGNFKSGDTVVVLRTW